MEWMQSQRIDDLEKQVARLTDTVERMTEDLENSVQMETLIHRRINALWQILKDNGIESLE